MRILLVLPASEGLRVRAGDRVPPRAMLRFSLLSLTTVAALTPPEHTVTLIDEHVTALDYDADADLVGITFMTALAPRAYEIASAFRRRGKLVVAGGYHATLMPAEVALHFDAVVCGEAETLWPRLLEDVAVGRLRRLYSTPMACAPETIPAPRRDLTAGTARHYITTSAVQATRGCRHACRYCSITAFHRASLRTRPVESVLDEVRRLPRHFMFVDDNIAADRDYAVRLFQGLAPLRKHWVSQCSLLIADDPELLRLARRAGCRGLFVGIESLDAGNLESVDKAFNQAGRYATRLAALRASGIAVVAGIIVGLDADAKPVFEKTLRFLERHRIDALQLNILTPLPGTPLFREYERQGRIADREWSHYDFRHVVFRPRQMTRGELQAGADWLYREFYRPWRIARRTLAALWHYGPLSAWLSLRLNVTYLHDNRRERIVGWNPAARRVQGSLRTLAASWRRRTAPRKASAAPARS